MYTSDACAAAPSITMTRDRPNPQSGNELLLTPWLLGSRHRLGMSLGRDSRHLRHALPARAGPCRDANHELACLNVMGHYGAGGACGALAHADGCHQHG